MINEILNTLAFGMPGGFEMTVILVIAVLIFLKVGEPTSPPIGPAAGGTRATSGTVATPASTGSSVLSALKPPPRTRGGEVWEAVKLGSIPPDNSAEPLQDSDYNRVHAVRTELRAGESSLAFRLIAV